MVDPDGFPLLPFPAGTIVGRFVRRFKRFFVEARTCEQPDGVLVHTNNTGAMLGLLRPGAPALLSPAHTPGRRLPWTLEALWQNGPFPSESTLPPGRSPCREGRGFWVGVNTLLPNRLLEAAFRADRLPWAAGYTRIRRESQNAESRLDACLEGPGLPRLWVECKSVTLVEDGVALFPDAVSERGLKHLGTLARIAASGERAAMFYVIQRPDARCFAPAEVIDPRYAEAFFRAQDGGVEMYPVVAEVGLAGVSMRELETA